MLKYAKKIKSVTNTNRIPHIYCISKHEDLLPLAKTEHHSYYVYMVNAKYMLLLIYSDMPALLDYLVRIIMAKIEALILITTSPPPFLPKGPKLHPAS